MSEKDNATKNFMEKDENFADAFNFLVFDGKPVIKPENLTSIDSAILGFPDGFGRKSSSIKKYRDVVKYLSVKRDENASYILLAIENQSKTHYAMPVRNMMYDAIQYEKQIRDLEDIHKKRKSKMSSSEYLSGFTKTDRLKPVVTLVINFSNEPWDGPVSLNEMIESDNEAYLKFIPDYRINLIDPFTMTSDDFKKFSSHLKEILLYLKCSRNKEELKQLLQTEKVYEHTPNEVVGLINILTGSNIKIDETAEETNMCQALQGLLHDSRIEGEKEGRKEGTLSAFYEMIKQGLITIDQAATSLGITTKQLLDNFKEYNLTLEK